MARVPPDLIEVGRLEGLSLFKEFLYVIMPLIWPIFSTTVILDLCGMLNAGGPVLLFGKDVINKTVAYTLPYWFFAQVNDNGAAGMVSGVYGLMSAVGLCLTAVSVPITLTIRHFLEKGATSEF
jgi:ABC-type sugar transport system permease subunit